MGVSPYGCYNMLGNISVWINGVNDRYQPDEDDIIYDYPTLKTLSYSSIRGGNYWSEKKYVRCSQRGSINSIEFQSFMGIRCAK